MLLPEKGVTHYLSPVFLKMCHSKMINDLTGVRLKELKAQIIHVGKGDEEANGPKKWISC